MNLSVRYAERVVTRPEETEQEDRWTPVINHKLSRTAEQVCHVHRHWPDSPRESSPAPSRLAGSSAPGKPLSRDRTSISTDVGLERVHCTYECEPQGRAGQSSAGQAAQPAAAVQETQHVASRLLAITAGLVGQTRTAGRQRLRGNACLLAPCRWGVRN